MQLQLKLVNDGITPHLKRIVTAFSRPVLIRIPAPLSAQLRVFQKAQAKARGQAAPAKKQPSLLRCVHLLRPAAGVLPHHLPPHLKAQLDRHARSEAGKIISSLR